MACVIPFPAPPRPAAEPDRYAIFKARVTEIFASAAAEQGLTREPQGLRHEEEILRRLCRIERMLSQMDVSRSAGGAAGSTRQPRIPLERILTGD
ncbi:hypothetical protein [Candidatus Accumulibacter contiguus]|jgi:hypothetical protein|uniref:hypothetical protein n=1 Tax=Candidatus Accumulibacter contiguus TaxID=2954381 RepID=UPI002FC3A438